MYTCRVNWVKVNGTKYQTPCALIVNLVDEDPLIGNIHNILVSGHDVFFEFELMDTVFLQHYHAYAVSFSSSSQQHFLVRQKDLITYHPYGLYHCPNISVTLPSQFCVLRSKSYIESANVYI